MQDWGRIGPNVAGIGQARQLPMTPNNGCDIAFSDAAEPMTAEGHDQRRAVRRHRIEVHPQRDHGFEQGERGGDMLHTLLDRPRPKVGMVYSLLYGNRAILVPA